MADNPPPVISGRSTIWNDGVGADPAKYLVNPGSVTLDKGVVKAAPGNLRHPRPYMVLGSKLFVFPIGVEGFTRSGQAILGLHRNIGDNAVLGTTINYEEGRIELTGMFPGVDAQDNMTDCISILTASRAAGTGLQLHTPGVFDNTQLVLPESWNFNHSEDDRTHSISYTITFVKIGTGRKEKDPHGKPAQQGPIIRKTPRGKPHKIFTVKAGARTFRQIAKIVYKNADAWQKIMKLNEGQITKWDRNHPKIPTHQLPTFRWPIGTKFQY